MNTNIISFLSERNIEAVEYYISSLKEININDEKTFIFDSNFLRAENIIINLLDISSISYDLKEKSLSFFFSMNNRETILCGISFSKYEEIFNYYIKIRKLEIINKQEEFI